MAPTELDSDDISRHRLLARIEALEESLYEEREKNSRLRAQVTYLQEEVARLEDELRDEQEKNQDQP